MIPRLKRLVRRLVVGLVAIVVLILTLFGLVIFAIETPWGKDQIRAFIVRQANDYLTATLEIDDLTGSLLRGVELSNIRLSRDGETIVSITAVNVNYTIRELMQPGLVIRSIRLTRPFVVARKGPDGRWNLAALVKQQARERDRSGPGRALEIASIEVTDGTVVLEDPLMFGAAHVPGRYDALNAELALAYKPIEWTFDFKAVSWTGGASDLTVERLSGRLARGSGGWSFGGLSVQTPASRLTLDGRIVTGGRPAVLDLEVRADRFAFQEWSGVLNGLRNIAVESSFTARLNGSLTNLATDIDLTSNGGDARGRLTLDTSTPGWLGAGAMHLTHLNLARWFNRTDRPSDITGHVTFDLALQLGRGIPRGTYAFNGPKAAYLGYEGENLQVRGDITKDEWRIADGTALAYGSDVVMSPSTVGLGDPYPFRFQGTARHVDLRRLPEMVPVPHVDSLLAFEFDARGQFARPFLAGRAWFEDSTFIGAAIGAGTVGAIDTSADPIAYSGEGDISQLDVRRFGEALDVGWMQDPRYDARIAGRFRVEGAGADSATMRLTGGGRLSRADLFHGTLFDAEVAVDIQDGGLQGSYSGRFDKIDPAVPFMDGRFAAVLTGVGHVKFGVSELLLRSPGLDDYDIDGTVTLENSEARGLHVARGTMSGRLSDSVLSVSEAVAEGPLLEGRADGTFDLSFKGPTRVAYEITRADPALLQGRLGEGLAAQVATKGTAHGVLPELRFQGQATVTQLHLQGVDALSVGGDYDAQVSLSNPGRTDAHVRLDASFVNVFGQSLPRAAGTVDVRDRRVVLSGEMTPAGSSPVTVDATADLHPNGGALDLISFTAALGGARWSLATSDSPPVVSWTEGEIAISQASFVETASPQQRVEVSGDWRPDGTGALHVVASGLVLDNFTGSSGAPARYGGRVDADATVRGTRQRPIVTGQVTIREGRVLRVAYDSLTGKVGYEDGMLHVDLRLDQSPGVWLTAAGTVPPSLFSRAAPEMPVNIGIRSSRVDLGLVEGVTRAVRDVTGVGLANIDIVGTTHDPHFLGSLELTGAGFVVSDSGARYSNGSARFDFTPDRITVSAFHLEDRHRHILSVRGSLGTHDLRVGDVAIDISAGEFEVLRNQFGTLEVQTNNLSVRGQFEAPRVAGHITINQGELKVDQILARALVQPYSTEASSEPPIDAIAALNLWERISMTIVLQSVGALRLVGESVSLSPNTTLGLGSFNIRSAAEIVIDKEPGKPISVTGPLDSLAGTFVFEGRRFELYPSSSVEFRGDFRDPELFIAVYRVVSGVEARVTISGPLHEPEIRLSSNPPLDPSDVLSLIVFNTTTNDLSAAQQQELTVRAGTLAVGFLANTLTSALERSLGLDIFEIEPGTGPAAGAKVTVGQEIVPGLVARFSRHFGTDEYDEATLEYYISRLFRLRATFTDGTSTGLRSPFRRIERGGIDLLMFFSF